jgi:hypothetical protein
MERRVFRLAAVVTLAAAWLWAPAIAGPAALSVDRVAVPSPGIVHEVHGCHSACALGPYGWHRHVGPFCERVACAPPFFTPPPPRPRCVTECKYIGPIKTCKTKCYP